MNTPPRSIRLDESNFGHQQSDDEENNEEEIAREQSSPVSSGAPYKKGLLSSKLDPRSASVESESFNHGHGLHGRNASDPSMSMMDNMHGGLGPWDEIQLVRRQIAKLNHRLMAVELENQQQQQREMILTVLVSCYFVGKFFMWLNRSP